MRKILIKRMILTSAIVMILAAVVNYLLTQNMQGTVILVVSMLVMSMLLGLVVIQFLSINIVDAVEKMNTKLEKITQGNFEECMKVETTPEFADLSEHINNAIKGILETTDKFSVVLDNVEFALGVYEYSAGMPRVKVTRQVADILFFDKEKAERYLADYILFADYLDMIRSHPVDEEKHIYRVLGDSDKYVQLESFKKENSEFGMVADVTENVKEQLRLEQEKKADIVTGLPSRSTLYQKLDELFEKPEIIGDSVLVMLDVTNLSAVNDEYGYEAGDKYLCGVADCIKSICPNKSVMARLTGGEFVLFIHSCKEEEELEEYVRILEKKKDTKVALENGTEISMELVYGFAYCEQDGKDYHELMKVADERLYEEKRSRKEKM